MFDFLHLGIKKRHKSYLPNPALEYRIVFKKNAIDMIKSAKGWKTDSEMAAALGLTRSYITMMRLTKVSVSAAVITRLAVQMNNVNGNWWSFFDIVPYGSPNPNHPTFNAEKEKGQIPYCKYSESAKLRKLDYPTEESPEKNN